MRAYNLLALITPLAGAYGPVGHRTIGYLAEKWLTPSAHQWISDILPPGFDFSEAAVWADHARDLEKWSWDTGPWHYVNNLNDNPPENICGIAWEDCDREKGCILSAIVNQTQITLNTTLPTPLRRNATMFLFHFLGDLHQPLHTVGFAVGGTRTKPVCWDSEPPEGKLCKSGPHLHSVWDSHIIHKQRGIPMSLPSPAKVAEKAAAAPWAAELFAKQTTEGLECEGISGDWRTTVVEWAQEVNGHACDAVYNPGVEWLRGHDLSEGYYEDHKALVEELVGKAGMRLGCWLNVIAEKLGVDEEGPMDDL